MTEETAKDFVDQQGPYYLGGQDAVEIPALAEGDKDPIFPRLIGIM